MILYAETSAILRWLLGAAGGQGIGETLAGAEAVFTSRLTLVEIERVLVRKCADGSLSDVQAGEARRLVGSAAAQWRVVEMSESICDRACQRFPVEPLRTLDAIHLATALFSARLAGDIALLSTDARVAQNADHLGLRLISA